MPARAEHPYLTYGIDSSSRWVHYRHMFNDITLSLMGVIVVGAVAAWLKLYTTALFMLPAALIALIISLIVRGP